MTNNNGKTEQPDVFTDVSNELARQDAKWGEQNHPLTPQNNSVSYWKEYQLHEHRFWKRENARRGRPYGDGIAWDGILLEEVFEALSAPTTDEQITELVQVAAVAIQMIASIKRNRPTGGIS